MNGYDNNLAVDFISEEDRKELEALETEQSSAKEKTVRLRNNIEQFCPKLDIEYLFQSRANQLKGFIRKRVSSEEDAEDLVQNTYLEAIKKSDNFRGLSRPDVWLFGIALNLVRNHRKKETNRGRVWEETIMHDPAHQCEAEDPSDTVEKNDFIYRLNEAVSHLPEDMVSVFRMVTIENLSYQQAAEVIGVPTGTVRSRLSRAREKLKGFLA